MKYQEISLPTSNNDYLFRCLLDGKSTVLHMAYNSTDDCWTIGFCDDSGNPIVDGIRVVPNFPLNIWYVAYDIPQGALFVSTSESKVSRYDFDNGIATLCYIPSGELLQ